jgi:hypothetical protein
VKALLAATLLIAGACAPAGSGADPAPAPAGAAGTVPPPPADAGATTEREGSGRALLLQPHPAARIVVERVDTVSMELPAGSQVQTFERTAYISSVAERSGDEYRMTFVLDSVVADSGSFLPPDSLAAAAGSRWTGRLLPDGQLLDLTLDSTRGRPRTGVGDQTARTLEVLYPVLPAEGVRAGAAWSDSVSTRIETSGFDVHEHGLIRYTASETGGGLQVVGNGTLRQEGSGIQFGQELAMSGEGTRTITYRFDDDGRLVGADGTDAAMLEIVVPAMGQTVPLTQNSRFDVTITAR